MRRERQREEHLVCVAVVVRHFFRIILIHALSLGVLSTWQALLLDVTTIPLVIRWHIPPVQEQVLAVRLVYPDRKQMLAVPWM